MKEFKGTKGPWFVDKFGDVNDTQEITDETFCIAACRGVLDIERDSNNANLIAAAPDLLEALDKITKEYIFTRGQLNGDFEDDLVDVLCIKNARAAIAKALGETK